MLKEYRQDTTSISDVVKSGFIAVTAGLHYITLLELEEEYIEAVKSAADKIEVSHIEAETSPKLTAALGCSAVPALFHIVDGVVSGRMIGAASKEQIKAFLLTGVPPT